MTASVRSRTVILAVACLGHVGLVLLLSSGTTDVSRRRSSVQEQEPLLLILLEDLLKPEPPPESRTVPRDAPAVETLPLPQASIEPDVSDSVRVPSAAEPMPSIDWAAETERAAGAAIERQLAAEALAENSRRRLAGHPKGMELPPPESRVHKLGDVEHFEGGETIEWINDRCYYTTAQPVLPNYFNMMLPICKPRSRK